MDKFPRDKQNELLLFLYEKAPNDLTEEEYADLITLFGSEINLYLNLWYLHEHGLIYDFLAHSRALVDDITDDINIKKIHITQIGVDFIRDDGGLSSILNVMTIKVHNETIEQLAEIINNSDLTAAEKTTFVGKLKELPADATKHLVFELLSKGLSHVPDVIQILSSYFRP